jgi:hypothetical protein
MYDLQGIFADTCCRITELENITAAKVEDMHAHDDVDEKTVGV